MAHFDGIFYDGKSAKRRAVRVEVGRQWLEIVEGDGGAMHTWPNGELWAPERPRKGAPLVISSRTDSDARLILEHPGAAQALRAAAPGFYRRAFTGPERAGLLIVAGVAAGAVLLALVLFWPAATQRAAALVPQAWQVRLGENVQTGMIGRAKRCESAEGRAAIDDLTRRLAAAAGRPIEVTVTVAQSKIVNAFAAPGGRIVFFNSILEKMDDPAEFAAILAHEMAHVEANHPMVSVVRMLGFDILLAVLVGDNSALAEFAGQAGALLALFAYSREAEAEADRLSFQMLARAGISPAALGDFFAKLEKGRPKASDEGISAFAHYLSTHPPTKARIEAAEAFAAAHDAPRRPALTSAQWRAVKTICAP